MGSAARRISLVCTLFTLLALPLTAQPTAVVNVASFANPNLPNGGVAQGSIFTVFGSGLGPAGLAHINDLANPLPLPTDLAGASVQVIVGGQSVDCFMIFTVSSQLAAILPSNTPLGEGLLTVTFNGQVSPPIPITVVANSFGIFGINQAGSGPAVITDANFTPLTVLNSAAEGQVVIAWGTGLGAVQGDEAAMPLPGDLPLDVQVLVGGAPAQVTYRGRSGCCIGLDQIVFTVPAGTSGCFVPVTVVVEGVASNFTTLAVTPSGGPCSDSATGIDANTLSQAQANGSLRFGAISATRTRTELTLPAESPAQGFSSISDSISGDFEEFTVSEVERISGFLSISVVGSCYVYQFRNSDGLDADDPVTSRVLDAGGSLALAGPEGMRTIPRDLDGSYFQFLSSGFSALRSFSGGKTPDVKAQFPGGSGYFQSGTHTVSGSGGADVGAFNATFEVGDAITWTNPTTSISRGGPFTVQWQGGSGDRVVIFGMSAYAFLDDEGSGAAFWCSAERTAGSFTIPQAVLSSLPRPSVEQGVANGIFAVGSQSLRPFSAPGVDIGFSSFTDQRSQFGIDYP